MLAPQSSQDLFDVLRERQAQARATRETYLAPVAEQDTMLYWLAQATKKAREAAGRKQVHVAASLSRDQSSVYRFEQAAGWPRNPDTMVSAYADDLDVDSIELWEQAIDLWRQYRISETPADERAVSAARRSRTP